ncbi:DUF6992 family protein [uncultured Fibrella sp.]|uniref:DUF6992 family protein n=1 Tax=uncultured Fibrella sp. TaxID=1284596 RepID=UPI0035CB8DF8
MNRLHAILYTVGASLAGQLAHGQPLAASAAERLQFSQDRYNHTRTLGLTLGGYALANLAVSGVAIGQSSGETKYIHQMNLYWNAVNLGIAGLGLLGLRKQHPESETLGEAVQKHNSMKQTLLFNAGLDDGRGHNDSHPVAIRVSSVIFAGSFFDRIYMINRLFCLFRSN